MITVRSPLPSHVEAARRQMERYLERMTAIEAKVEREKKKLLDERCAREAAEAVERVAEKLRRRAELEAEAVKAAQADAEIRSMAIIPIGAILGACAVFYDVPISSLFAEHRSKDVVKTRQIAMYLAKELTPRSLPDIGRRIGGRDHTTVLHGVRKIAALIKSDPGLAAEVATIRPRIVGRIEGGRETEQRRRDSGALGHNALRPSGTLPRQGGFR
jgi:chromosomal replication initiation ATPase DnaA